MRSRLATVLVWLAAACGDDTSSTGGGGAGGEPAGAGGAGASETTGGGGSGGSPSTGGAGATGGDGGAAGADPTGGTGAGGANPRCDAPGDCPTGAECEERTCVDGLCGLSPLPLGSPLPDPTDADCQRSQCDGDGSAASVPDDTDLPDDANPCTVDACDAGTPTHLPEPSSTPCGVDLLCDGAGTCVGCVLPSDCPGADTACATRTCTQGTCGVAFTPDGTPVPTQTAGDCAETRCDGAGAASDAIDDTDLPVDGLACTLDVCTAGLGSNPTASAGTPCTETGGTACNDSGVCVAPPIVLAVSPASGANGVLASTPIGVTFDQPMLAASLTAQTTAGPCSGALQVSLDDFASCVALDGPLAVLSGGGTFATITPRPGLLVNRTYRVRGTTAATSVATLPLAAPFTLPLGFTTMSPDLCAGSLVVSQLYGGGGNVGASFSHDFVELHNRGTTSISLDGLSLQYAPNQTTTWGKVDLTGMVPAGGYFLVQLQSNNQGGAPLPTADLASVNFGMSMMVGKLALLAQTTTLPNGTICPSSNVVDLVGYGGTNCFEGPSAAPALNATTAAVRAAAGCGDIGWGAADHAAATPAPRTSATPPAACGCAVLNESGAPLEADYCATQFPLSLDVTTGSSSTVFARIFEAGVTNASAGASPLVRAQVGFGLPTANPQYETFTWLPAAFNAAFVDASNDEYQATLVAPSPGTYRFTTRLSLDGGITWTVCDNNQTDAGSGSNPGHTFALGDLGALTVAP